MSTKLQRQLQGQRAKALAALPREEDREYMLAALEEAREAYAEGEIPVGAVIVRGGEIIARAHNTREQTGCVLGHAETEAIRIASAATGDWRLSDCTLYVTLEPCPMCAGAIIGAQLARVVYGAKDPSVGAMGSVVRLQSYPIGAIPAVTVGVLEPECSQIIRDFFSELREKRKKDREGH